MNFILLDIAFKDYKAKKSRAAMCIIGVMACVILIGVVNNVMYDMQTSLKGDLNSINGKIYFEKKDTGYPPMNSVLTQNISDQALANNVVDPDKSSAVLMGPLQGTTSSSSTPVMIVGLTPGKEQAYINGTKVNGKSTLTGESDNAVILGSQAAKTYNATVGSTFTVNNQQYKVVGVMDKQGTGWPTTLDSSVIASLPFVQNVTERPGSVTTVIITPKNGVSITDAQNNLQNSFSSTYGVYTQKDAQKTFDDNFKGFNVFMNMVTGMIFIVSMILIMNVMMMSVKEKTKEIGTMRALGTTKRSVLSLIVYESLILSGIGGIIGIILISPAYNLIGLLMGATSFTYSLPLSVLLQVAVIVLVIGTFSGLIPAYQATRISPIEALRYE